MARFDEMSIQRKQFRTVLLLGIAQWLCISVVAGCLVYLLVQMDWSHGLRGILLTIWEGRT